MEVPTFSEGTESSLSICCTSCFDVRSQKIARAVAQGPTSRGDQLGIIGNEESCCGESIRKAGEEEVFQKLASANIALYNSKGVKKIIVTSPHCLYTLRRSIPELGGDYEVFHYTEVLSKAVADGKLKLGGDPQVRWLSTIPAISAGTTSCTIPREIMAAIPGADLKEMPRNHANSLCCQGGGGRF